MSTESQSVRKVPALLRNYLSLVGAAIAAASLTSILLLFLIDFTSGSNNPYLGIFAYVLFPGILVFSLVIILAGMLLERRRRRRLTHSDEPPLPRLDLNDPRSRRSFLVFLSLTFLFICLSAFGSYRAYDFTESVEFCGKTCHTVMKPEFVAYQASPHARIRCVECHVGPGPGGYISSKVTGAYQLYAVAFNKYPRPISAPVHHMPAASFTCEKCHWPERFYGDELKVFNHYGYDEKNTLSRTRMLINVGGGSPDAGPFTGIHWHMNLANKITFIAADEERQNIPWIRAQDAQGNVTEYVARDAHLTPGDLAKAPKRRMDCMDCHNRPAHIYVSPDEAVDQAFEAGKLSTSLPYLKQQAVGFLSRSYDSNGAALSSIASGLDSFYRTNYADIYAQNGDSIKGAIAEVKRIYGTYFFPEMKADWKSHPNNLGHYYFQGCFRCHDGQHVSSAGKVIRNDCNICHTTLDQSAGAGGTAVAAQGGVFKHPVELGNLAGLRCTVCHKGDRGFQHPIFLGDLSGFKCVDCHGSKIWSGNGQASARAPD